MRAATSPLDAELDPLLDEFGNPVGMPRDPRIVNTMPQQPQTSPSSEPGAEIPLDEPRPAGVDPGVQVVPPIDQGTYGPPPGTDPTAPPPVQPPNVGEAQTTPPVSTGGNRNPSRPDAPMTEPVVDQQLEDQQQQGPQTFNSLPAAVPFEGGIGTHTVDDMTPQPVDAPPLPAPPGGTIPPETQPPPVAETPVAQPAAQPTTATDTTAEDERMKRLLETNRASVATAVPTTQIDPDNSLVGQQVLPSESERYKRLRGMQDSQLEKVANGPNRFQMATDRFSQFEKDTAPEYDLNRKKALSDAANFGFTGSGRLNTDYGNLELTRERDMDSQRSRLFNTALDQTVDDDRGLLDTLHQFTGDEAEYDRGGRDETRGERGYERSLSEQALADQMEAAKLDEGFTQSEFDRDQDRLRTGYANDPSAQYEEAARAAAKEGQISSKELAQILAFIGQQRKQQPAGAEG